MNPQQNLVERIEKKREELYDASLLYQKIRVLDPDTYAVSLELDELIDKYMKKYRAGLT